MDAFACNIAHTHADDADPDTRPVMLVTAAVDSMTVVRELGPCINEDLQLRGYCSYVGRSSVEVVVELAQASAAQPIVTATFLLVRLLGSVTIRSPHYADCCRCLLLCLPMRVHRWPRTHSQSRRWPSTLWCHTRRWTMNGWAMQGIHHHRLDHSLNPACLALCSRFEAGAARKAKRSSQRKTSLFAVQPTEEEVCRPHSLPRCSGAP